MSRYACSDIHGQYSLFLQALEGIGFSEKDHMYIIGDAIDRGPDSIGLLRNLMKRENITLLLGNHEYMMIQYLKGHPDGRPWTHPGNGGRLTLEGYELLEEKEKKEIRTYLEDLYLQVELEAGGKTFLLSHSAFLQGIGSVKWKSAEEDAADVVWYSPWRTWEYIDPEAYALDGREHIIGHVPTILIPDYKWPEGVCPRMPSAFRDRACRITNIDCGCAILPRLQQKSHLLPPGEDPGLALCVLDLDLYAREDPAALRYFSEVAAI